MQKICKAFVTFALGATPAYADVAPRNLPACTLYTVGGKEVCGYADLEDWKLVLEADAKLSFLDDQLKNEQEKGKKLTTQVDLLSGQLSTCSGSQDLLKSRVEVLTSSLVQLDKKYQALLTRSSPLPWILTGVTVAALGGVILGLSLD